MTTAASAVAATLAISQEQLSLLAIRVAAEGQRQLAEMLDAHVAAAANPPHLGNRIDTLA
jgi:hypothetical protein